MAELWFDPDDTRILELSTKCPPADAFRAAAETRGYLAQRGIDIDGEQEIKTRRALDFFDRATPVRRDATADEVTIEMRSAAEAVTIRPRPAPGSRECRSRRASRPVR